MKTDIVFPSGNEEKFVERAQLLGFDKLIFIYEKINEINEINKINQVEFGIEIKYGVLVKEKNKKNLINKINKIKQKGFLVLVEAVDDKFNRFILEKTRADILFGVELVHKKDAMHYRRSGLDQILCKIAAEKKKIIGFSFKEVSGIRVLGRLIQNLKFCKKYKVRVMWGSWANSPEEMKSSHDLRLFKQLLQQKFL